MNKQAAKFLKKNIFKTDEFYQFELLFKNISRLESKSPKPLAVLERAYIYDGISIFSVLFKDLNKLIFLDYRPKSAKRRRGFQSKWITKTKLSFSKVEIKVIDTGKKFIIKNKLPNIRSLFLPNVLHHCRNFEDLLKTLVKKAKQLKKIYVFDSYIRENHQDPDDYCRFTPSALTEVLKKINFKEVSRQEIGNVFDVILYFVSQAKEILRRKENLKLSQKLYKLLPDLKKRRKSKKYRSLGRPHASACSAYFIEYKKAS